MLPNEFPDHWKNTQSKGWRDSLAALKRVDFLGAALLLLFTVLLLVPLEEAGVRFPWRSAFVISLLVISGILGILFFIWERKVTLKDDFREPVFPWRFVRRIWIGMLL